MTQTKIAPNRLKRYRRMWRDIRADWILYLLLVPGMVFTIEPMINAGTQEIDMSHPNGWTVVTADGKDTAQWEVQVLVTEDGYELLSW